MASSKLQKPANETSSHPHEEHKFGQKISEMTAKVFGHKPQEHQQNAKHCTTCRCPAPHTGAKPAFMDPAHHKEHAVSKTNASGHAKPTSCIELKKKEKQHVVIAPTKDSRPVGSAEMRNTGKKDRPAHNYFSNMTDHLKEKITMMKKTNDGKSKDSSSSSDSDSCSENEAGGKKKQKNKTHTKGTKHIQVKQAIVETRSAKRP